MNKELIIQELQALIEKKQWLKLQNQLVIIHEADIAEILEELPVKESLIIYRLLAKTTAVEVFSFLDKERQSEITSLVNDQELKEIVEELYFDDMIDLIEEVPANIVKKILKNTSITERKLINQFLNYPEDSAGSIMTIEFTDLKKEMTVAKAMQRIKKIGYDRETIYTLYVTNVERRLEGILSLKNLVLANNDDVVAQLMATDYLFVRTQDDQEHVAKIFKKYDLLSVPVVDREGRLVGIITIDDIVDVIEEETTEDFQKMAAIEPTDDEYLTIKPLQLAKKRIMWLIILMFSAVLTEIITNSHQKLLMQFTFLAGVVPMLMSTGGNAGAQSSTLVIRGLTLGDITFKDIFSVIWKEVRVGILMGIGLGLLNFLRIYAFGGGFSLAVIVGFTLIGTATMATVMGGLLPIVAKKLKLDPAIMASPLITTLTDATTLIIFYAIASFILL